MIKMGASTQGIKRKLATKEWMKNFKKFNKRKPTNQEGRIFGIGFNMGWKFHRKWVTGKRDLHFNKKTTLRNTDK